MNADERVVRGKRATLYQPRAKQFVRYHENEVKIIKLNRKEI